MIPLGLLLDQLDRYAGWTYAPEVGGVRDCRYPLPVPGLPGLAAPPPRQADCVTFVEGFVLGAAGLAGHVEWGRAFHRRMMIADPRDRFGPVDAVTDAGLAVRIDLAAIESAPALPAPLVCQGWGPAGGHTFILWERRGDRLLRLECSKSQGGVVWRDVGPVRGATPPHDWDLAPRPWTVARLRAAYPELAIAALRVADDVDGVLALGSPVTEREPEGGGSVRA